MVYKIPDEYYDAQIQLLVGDAGTGKTFWALNHKNNMSGIYLDLEHRYEQMLVHHKEIKVRKADPELEKMVLGTYTNCLVYNEDYSLNRIETFNKVAKVIDKAITLKPKLIVVDGISDLRRMAKEKYEAETNKQAFGFQAWGAINNMVKGELYRLFNYARIHQLQVILTTFFSPVYENGEQTKEVTVDAKDYIIGRVDEVLAFYRKGIDFYFKRGKSPRGPTLKQDWTVGADGNEN